MRHFLKHPFHFLVSSMTADHKNSAADVPDEFKTPLALIYKALHGKGISNSDYIECLETANYSVSPSQLNRWVANIGKYGSAIHANKQSGAPALLDREERDVMSGRTLHENENGKQVTLETYHDFALDHLDKDLSYPTISRYFDEDRFTSRLVQKKAKSFVVDSDALCKEAWDWVYIQDFRARNIQRDKFASIDFTFTGHRTDRTHSFAPSGGPQPMVSESISPYTNCIVTCGWSDGINRTPPKLFTYNPAFRTDRKKTKRRSDQIEHLNECLDKYGISEDRVVYIGKDKGETTKYTRECPELIRIFFDGYTIPPDSRVYSDNGNSFFDEGNSVLEEVGFLKHRCYPAKVHQYLSMNDNALHGTSKRSWRSSGVDFSDDVKSCLILLSFLDRDIVNYSKHWWDRNLINVTEEGMEALIGKGPCKLSHLHKSWKRSYEDFMNENNFYH
jgi:transposase